MALRNFASVLGSFISEWGGIWCAELISFTRFGELKKKIKKNLERAKLCVLHNPRFTHGSATPSACWTLRKKKCVECFQRGRRVIIFALIYINDRRGVCEHVYGACVRARARSPVKMRHVMVLLKCK